MDKGVARCPNQGVVELFSLTDRERNKFAAYLEFEAQSDNAMAEQMDKLGGAGMDVMARKLRAEAAAALLIARKLRSTETATIES